ncbi:MAG: tetratricopeptide repeat protein [Bacteroidota bacterium]
MKRIVISFIVFFSLAQSVTAGYDVNQNCKTAWMLLMDLRIEEAKQVLANEIQVNPNNYYAYYLDQTCDAYAYIINSNDEKFDAFVNNFEKRRNIMDDHDIDSPYYLACLAEMQLQVGVFSILKGAHLSGLRKAYSSYKNTYKNLDKYPNFKQSLKIDGFFNVAISNVPPFVKWAVSFFGVSANPDYGFKVLYDNYESQKNIEGINAESALYIILTAKINKTPEMVYDFTRLLDTNISQTIVHQYFRANIAYRIGKNEEALSILQQINIDGNPHADIIYSYLMGKILLRKLDDGARYYLARYLRHLEKEEYVKEINYKLALFNLVNNNRLAYSEYCEIVIDQGKDVNERDREALYDAELDYFPDVNLVKARLLLDGGYYDEFKMSIDSFNDENTGLLPYILEYDFLMGRFYAAKGDYNDAISQFVKVIELGGDEDYYFASEAALRLGNIYYEMGQKEIAKQYFEKSIKLYKSDYYEYIEDKAAKGLK